MSDRNLEHGPAVDVRFARILSWYAIAGCVIFTLSILIADFVVPHHDWMADTISDLGAGQYEYIVDIGIYAFSASLLALAMCGAHLHPGSTSWSIGLICLSFLALVVFLVGARNEYGDQDQDGTVIHIYLVYALGVLMAVVPLLMARGAGPRFGTMLRAVSVLWILAAPPFFWMPDTIDGVYERGLGLISFAMVAVLSALFLNRVRGFT